MYEKYDFIQQVTYVIYNYPFFIISDPDNKSEKSRHSNEDNTQESQLEVRYLNKNKIWLKFEKKFFENFKILYTYFATRFGTSFKAKLDFKKYNVIITN